MNKQDKGYIQWLATGTVHFLLLEGSITKLDVGLTDDQLHSIVVDMTNRLGYFYEELWIDVNLGEFLGFNLIYGKGWEVYNPEDYYKTFNIRRKKLDKAQINDLQMLTCGLVHYIYRNSVVENLHANKNTNLKDSYMKIINKDMMNRTGFLLENLIFNKSGWGKISQYLIENSIDYLDMYNTKELKKIKNKEKKLIESFVTA